MSRGKRKWKQREMNGGAPANIKNRAEFQKQSSLKSTLNSSEEEIDQFYVKYVLKKLPDFCTCILSFLNAARKNKGARFSFFVPPFFLYFHYSGNISKTVGQRSWNTDYEWRKGCVCVPVIGKHALNNIPESMNGGGIPWARPFENLDWNGMEVPDDSKVGGGGTILNSTPKGLGMNSVPCGYWQLFLFPLCRCKQFRLVGT